MELTGLTRDHLDERLRQEVGVDLLAGRVPALRLVALGRREPVMVAEARVPHDGEPALDPLLELLYLVNAIRPRGFVLCFHAPIPPAWRDEHPFELAMLWVARAAASPRLSCVVYPFSVSEIGMVSWGTARYPPVPPGLRLLARYATRRKPRARRRPPAAVTDLLVADGHRVEMAPALQARLGVDRTGGVRAPGG